MTWWFSGYKQLNRQFNKSLSGNETIAESLSITAICIKFSVSEFAELYQQILKRKKSHLVPVRSLIVVLPRLVLIGSICLEEIYLAYRLLRRFPRKNIPCGWGRFSREVNGFTHSSMATFINGKTCLYGYFVCWKSPN
jgi:hypothetical protein